MVAKKSKKSVNKETSTSNKKNLISKSINPWMIASIALAIILVVGAISTSASGISKKTAEKKFVAFAQSQGADVQVEGIKSVSGFYRVTYNYQGSLGTFDISKDGKYIGQMDSLDGSSSSSSSTPATPDNIPKSDRPNIELFVMSYCPYGTQIEKGFLPVVKSSLGDKIDFEVKFVDYVMHPSVGETEENLVQYCIQKEQKPKYLDYLQCFLAAGDTEGCVKEIGIDKAKLDSCYDATEKEYGVIASLNDRSTWVSGQFPQFNIHKEENNKYGVQGSPTLVVNGVQVNSGRSPAALLATVCAAFENAPEECSTLNLPTDTPSAGLGYGTAPSDTAALMC